MSDREKKAVARVVTAVEAMRAGKTGVLTVYTNLLAKDTCPYYTVGPYSPHGGPDGFAVLGYHGAKAGKEFHGANAAQNAARAIVKLCGPICVEAAVDAWEKD